MINNIINLKVNNNINVEVDRNNLCISPYELQENFDDLFKFKKKYSKGECIKLSQLSDICCDILFCGIDKETKVMSFKLC